jgi:hypothetical protein
MAATEDAAKKNAVDIISSAPYFEIEPESIKFAVDTSTDDLMLVWEDTPLRVEIRILTVDKPLEHE